MRTILHAGCGKRNLPQHPLFEGKEIRLDIDPDAEPDIVAPIQDLGDIGPFDAVYTSHCLEHVHWDDAEKALREFHRVLNPGGFAMMMVPDLTGIQPTEDEVYKTHSGMSITGLDMFYGYRGYTSGNPYMRHQCGFVPATLKAMMERAGFGHVMTHSVLWNLIATGVKT